MTTGSDREVNPQKGVQIGPAAPQGEDSLYPRWPLAVAAMIVAMFMVILDTSIVNIAIPAMERDFHIGTAQVQWVVTVYMLAVGLAAPASGWLADRIGYKRLYLAGLAVFTAGSVLSAAAPSLPLLVGARVIQGLAGAPFRQRPRPCSSVSCRGKSSAPPTVGAVSPCWWDRRWGRRWAAISCSTWTGVGFF